MFQGLTKIFDKFKKAKDDDKTKNAAKERLHLVLMQDRANVSADFLELMKQEIIEVIKKYIDVDEKEIDVRLTNKANADGTVGAPALYANIPIVSIKNEARKVGHVAEKADEEKEKKSKEIGEEVSEKEEISEEEEIEEIQENKEEPLQELEEENEEETNIIEENSEDAQNQEMEENHFHSNPNNQNSKKEAKA